MRYVTTVMSIAFLVAAVVGCGGSNDAPPVASASSGGAPPAPGGYGGGYGGGGGGAGGYSADGYGGGAGGGYGEPSSDQQNASEAEDGTSDDASAQDSGAGQPQGGQGGYGSGYGDAYATAYPSSAQVDFRGQIEPILRQRCYSCHGPGERANKGDIRLHTPDEITAAQVVSAGNPNGSELITRITAAEGSEEAMPPKGPRLTTQEVGLIRTWIQLGASYGADAYASQGSGYGDGGYGAGVAEERRPEPPKTFDGKADLAFRTGQDGDAMLYLFAHALTDTENGPALLEKYRWVSSLKRPTLGVRWGLGVQYTEKGRVEGDPKPIGTTQDLPQGRRDDRRRGDSGYGGSSGVSSRPGGRGADRDTSTGTGPQSEFTSEGLQYYTGDVGAKVVERLRMRHERAYYGDVLKEAIESLVTGGDDEFGDDRFGGYGDPYGAPPRRGGPNGGNRGGFADGYGGGQAEEADDAPEDRIHQIMPGVTMLGLGKQSQLLEKARQQGVDALIVFDVEVDWNARIDVVYNETRIRLVDVAKGDVSVSTRQLNNVEIQRALEKDEEDETVDLELDKIFEKADELYRCVEFPKQARPEHVARRVSMLLAQQHENPLWVLSEMRYYNSRKLLADDQLVQAFAGIVGQENAPKLAGGPAEDRKAVIEQWLPSEQLSGESGDSADSSENRPFR